MTKIFEAIFYLLMLGVMIIMIMIILQELITRGVIL